MQDKVKLLMIIFGVLAIVLFILSILINKKNDKNVLNEIEYIEGAYDFELNKIERVKNKSEYYAVEKCINRFLKSTLDNNKRYQMLDDEYINLFNLKPDELEERITTYESFKLDITDMYVSQIGELIYTYFVYGNIINYDTNELEKLAIIVKQDDTHRTFSILPYEYLEAKNYLNLNENSKIDLQKTEEIPQKTANTFSLNHIDESIYVEYLLSNYIDRCLYNTKLAYDNLDEEYKKQKFENYADFVKYVINHKELYESNSLKNAKKDDEFENYDEYLKYLDTLNPLKVESYSKKKNKDYMQYVIRDNFGNYYVFKEYSTKQYKVLLDTYTIELPEFIEKYQQSDSKTKTALNIQKIVEALNNQDYKYVYGKLADTFKNNYFKTLESFEEYAIKTFGINNEITYLNFVETNNYCTYEIQLKNEEAEITKTIIMLLKEGTDFVMSFNL